MCKVQRFLIFYKPIPQNLFPPHVLLWLLYPLLLLLWFCSLNQKPILKQNLQDNSIMAYILFWFSLSCSLNNVLLTLFPSDKLFHQLRLHNNSPIDKFFTICFGSHHGKFIAKILHLIFLIDNGQNSNNSIDIL